MRKFRSVPSHLQAFLEQKTAINSRLLDLRKFIVLILSQLKINLNASLATTNKKLFDIMTKNKN